MFHMCVVFLIFLLFRHVSWYLSLVLFKSSDGGPHGGCRTHVMDAAHGGTANVYEFTTFVYKTEEKSTTNISGPLKTLFKKCCQKH